MRKIGENNAVSTLLKLSGVKRLPDSFTAINKKFLRAYSVVD